MHEQCSDRTCSEHIRNPSMEGADSEHRASEHSNLKRNPGFHDNTWNTLYFFAIDFPMSSEMEMTIKEQNQTTNLTENSQTSVQRLRDINKRLESDLMRQNEETTALRRLVHSKSGTVERNKKVRSQSDHPIKQMQPHLAHEVDLVHNLRTEIQWLQRLRAMCISQIDDLETIIAQMEDTRFSVP